MAGQNTYACGSPTIDASDSGTESFMKDPGWKYVTLANPPSKNNLKCIFCRTVTKAGIHRAKQHIVGGFRNTKACPAVPPNVRKEIQEYMEKKAAAAKAAIVPELDFDFTNMDTFGDSEDELRIELEDGDSYKGQKGKKAGTKGPIDKLFAATNKKLMRERKREISLRQTTLNETYKKEQRIEVCQSIARWLYDAGVSFNAVKYKSWKRMFTDVANYGRGFKATSYHEVRVPLLKQAIAEVKAQLKSYEEEWKTYGCSIMADGWTDKRQRTLINFLVNSPRGTVFIESIDASSYAKTGEKMFELLDSFVEKIGEANVVQVVTDNASSNVLAGKLLEAKRPNLFWTPCAAHCIDLMLEDIAKLSTVTKTLKRAMNINGYTYTRPGVVHMLRTFTGQTELVRAGTTRFATAYLTLRRFYKLKNNLRKMFTSEEWISSKWANEQAGRNVRNIILMPSIFANILYILKIYGPLVRVLRLVDGERLPAMAYIYEAMDRAKEAIATSFNGKEEKYKAVFQIIDRRWNNQLHRPLHAAGHFLNPQFYYDNPDIAHNEEIMDGLYETLRRLVPQKTEQDKISAQFIMYQNAQRMFGKEIAIRQRKTRTPSEWWQAYGSSAPELQKFALKVVNLTCSASGCERNWSIFEHVHTKKRNNLDQKKLNDLVFVKYNRALMERSEERDTLDPISLRDIDESNEWLMGEMEESEPVFGGDDDLTWNVVAMASGVEENPYPTRGSKGKSICLAEETTRVGQKRKASGSRDRSQIFINDEKEDEVEQIDTEEEELIDEDFKSDSSEDEECLDLDDDLDDELDD